MLTKQIQINQQNYRLEIGFRSPRTCWRCKFIKIIAVVSYRELTPHTVLATRPFCQPCALANVDELAEGDYEVPNKPEVIRDLRRALRS